MAFKEYKAEELIEEISMGPFGSNIKKECFVDSGIPVLNGSNLTGYVLNEDSFGYLTEEKADSLGKVNAHRGDVVITHRGTLGQVIFIPQDSTHDRYVISQSQFRVKCNDKIMPEYMAYFLHTPIGQYRLLSNASQVGVPALARATSTFKKLVFEVPDMEIQRKIINVLETLRKKIETNNKINRNLSEQANTIFSQFYERATDTAHFSDRIKVLGGGTPKTGEDSYWNGGIPFFTPKDVGAPYTFSTEKCISEDGLNHCNSRLYPMNTTFVTARGTVGKVALAGVPMAMNQSCYALASDAMDSLLVYFYTLEVVKSLKHKASGAVFDAIVTRDFDTEQLNFMTKEASEDFLAVVTPMMNQVHKNTVENLKLGELRDSLLPKLMSGELDVSELDI